MDKVLYVVAVACALAAFVWDGHSQPNSTADIEAASLFVLSPLLAVAGFHVARGKRRRPAAGAEQRVTR